MKNISIVIPIYNKASVLRNTLDSVIRQSMEEIEIVCVDDCSTDGSADILKEYERNDSRVKAVYHESNMGTSQSRKDGVAVTSGKYVMFLDGDDEFASSEACATAFSAIEANATDMVQFGTEVVNCAGMPEGRIKSNEKFLRQPLKISLLTKS